MDGQELAARAAATEAELEVALAGLRAAEARLGEQNGDGEDGEHDRLTAACQNAERAARAAHRAFRRWQELQQVSAEPVPPPVEPTPRLLFARWLYQHGYIAG